jgi:GT2 family glycosyltransferase
MKVHIQTPYTSSKDLGKIYNEEMKRIPDGDAACFIDYDVMFLTPDAGAIIQHYYNLYPNALLTCYTNRVSSLSKRQLLNGEISEDSDIRNHIILAEQQRQQLFDVTPIKGDISGMLMVIPKSLWAKHQFDETGRCLGVDTYYGRKLRNAAVPILRMNGIYVFHCYRMLQGIHDKSHLL